MAIKPLGNTEIREILEPVIEDIARALIRRGWGLDDGRRGYDTDGEFAGVMRAHLRSLAEDGWREHRRRVLELELGLLDG